MVSLRQTVQINAHEFIGFMQGKSFAYYPYLYTAAELMLDNLAWWVEALNAARAAKPNQAPDMAKLFKAWGGVERVYMVVVTFGPEGDDQTDIPVLPARIGLLQIGDDEFAHSHHGLHGALGAGSVGAHDGFEDLLGHDLPGQAEPVLEPAALAFLTAVGGHGVPEVIHFGLIGAGDEERYGLGELEPRIAAERHELLVLKLKLGGKSRLARGSASDVGDFGVLKRLGVKFHSFIDAVVEPQTGLD